MVLINGWMMSGSGTSLRDVTANFEDTVQYLSLQVGNRQFRDPSGLRYELAPHCS